MDKPGGARRAVSEHHRSRVKAFAIIGAIAVSFVAGVLVGPVVGSIPQWTSASAMTPAAPQVVSAPTTPSSPSPKATKADCHDVTDTRTTADELTVPFTVCGVALISKDHRVSADFTPKLVTVPVRGYGIPEVRLQPVAATALEHLFADARTAGYTLVVQSSYRSYATQKKWYATMSHARTAPPGASEHQSGLAVDLGGLERGVLVHGTAFAATRTGKWLTSHAGDYGFILRYPTSQSKITGIAYEPWHFRYVGVAVAAGVNATKTKTLERYLKVD